MKPTRVILSSRGNIVRQRVATFLVGVVWVAIGGPWACRDAEPPSARTVVDTLPDGRVHVSNGDPGAWAISPAWRLVEDLRIGGSGAEPEAEFGFVAAIVTNNSGQIFVLDVLAQQIRVFDSTGQYSHTIGAKGNAPGEFTGVAGMVFGPADTLWVMDPRANRYSAFLTDGSFVRGFFRNIPGYQDNPWPGRVIENVGLVDVGLRFPEERIGTVAGGRVVVEPVSIRQDSSARRAIHEPMEYRRELAMIGGAERPVVFFSNVLHVLFDDQGELWFADASDYTVHRRTLAGDTLLTFDLSATPLPIAERERDYVRSRTLRRPELLGDYLAALPETKPIIHRILGDNAGHIFIVSESRESDGMAVDAFADDGTFLGRMVPPKPWPLLPPPRLVVHATPDHLYVLLADDDDVPYVSRLRIHRTSP